VWHTSEVKSWLEASLLALEKGGPMTARSIVQYISDNGVRPITGETPEATVGAVLYTAIQNGNPAVTLREAGVFVHTGKASPSGPSETLGRLEEVDPRDIWRDEARHFTPWLLDNADYLGEVLGIELELETREHSVGAFSLDLYGRDITNGCVLIVENQLEATDHKHLGQLLTYAAGTGAKTVVWVSPEFRDEHQKAIDFLNAAAVTASDSRVRYFGVEIGVVRISDSVPAPRFTVVASPSDWSVDFALSQVTDEANPRKAAYRAFWGRYLQELHASNPGITNVRATTSANWIGGNYLRRGVQISIAFIKGGQASVEIYIDLGNRKKNEDVFYALQESKLRIEKEIGKDLQWQELPGKRACRIRLAVPGSIDESSKHAVLIKELVGQHAAFKRVFKPLVDELPQEIWDQDVSLHEGDD
jgi:hypothetical protein